MINYLHGMLALNTFFSAKHTHGVDNTWRASEGVIFAFLSIVLRTNLTEGTVSFGKALQIFPKDCSISETHHIHDCDLSM